MTKYIVGVGGSDKAQWDEYGDLGEAMERALELAEEQAEQSTDVDDDVDNIDTYDNGPDDRGACPEGQPGSYWPVVREIEE